MPDKWKFKKKKLCYAIPLPNDFENENENENGKIWSGYPHRRYVKEHSESILKKTRTKWVHAVRPKNRHRISLIGQRKKIQLSIFKHLKTTKKQLLGGI